MNKFAQVALSSLIAVTSVTSIATSVKAQEYNPQQFSQSSQAAFNPVGKWQCQVQEQGNGLSSKADLVMNLGTNRKLNVQGNGILTNSNGESFPIEIMSVGSWSQSNDGLSLSGHNQLYFQNKSTSSSFSNQEFQLVEPGSITNQRNLGSYKAITTCQKL